MIRNLSLSAMAFGAAALTFGSGVGMAVSASAEPVPYSQTQSPSYDGYCYAKKTDLAKNDAMVGAAAGALAGTLLGKKGDKVKSAAIGAAVGGAAGYVVAKNSKAKIRCSKGKYFVFTKGYYEPNDPGRGYKTVFFEERPATVDLYVRSKGKDVPYRGR